MPGIVWARNELVYRKDITRSVNFPRMDEAKLAGLKSGFALPVRAQDSIVGVMEFFTAASNGIREHTARLLSGLCERLGHFIVRLQAQLALQRQTRELERSNSDLRQFAAIAAHEIEQPLRAITERLKKLKRQANDAAVTEQIDAAVESIAFMHRTLGDLISYSELDQADAEEPTPVSLNTVLQWVKIHLHGLIQKELAVITEDALPETFGNEALFKRLFQNLIENAIRHHGPNPPRIHVSASRGDEEWTFCVKDNGVAIPADELTHIFEFRHRGQTGADAGIGIAICRRIVERMGGRIWATSQPDRGSEFCFTLPRRPA
jgi:signal transduction histidine kinase